MIKNLRNVEGFEKYSDYSITSDGKVISYKGKNDRILKKKDNGKGYLQVNLFLNGKGKHILIHRLVALAFVKGYSEGLTVDHIDENKNNNNFNNLQWMTRGNNGKKSQNKPVVQLTLEGQIIKICKSMHQAERIGGFNQGNISSVCLNKANYKTHLGFKWEFEENYSGINGNKGDE